MPPTFVCCDFVTVERHRDKCTVHTAFSRHLHVVGVCVFDCVHDGRVPKPGGCVCL